VYLSQPHIYKNPFLRKSQKSCARESESLSVKCVCLTATQFTTQSKRVCVSPLLNLPLNLLHKINLKSQVCQNSLLLLNLLHKIAAELISENFRVPQPPTSTYGGHIEKVQLAVP